MTAGDADGVTGALHAWANRPSFIDRFAQRHVVKAARGADVAHAGEARHQSVARVHHAEDGAERIVISNQSHVAFGVTKHAADQVRVRIDEAGKQSYLAKIYDFRPGGNWNKLGIANSSDLIVGDDHNGVIDRRRASAVNQTRGPQRQHAFPFRRLRTNAQRRRILRQSGNAQTKNQSQYNEKWFAASHCWFPLIELMETPTH